MVAISCIGKRSSQGERSLGVISPRWLSGAKVHSSVRPAGGGRDARATSSAVEIAAREMYPTTCAQTTAR